MKPTRDELRNRFLSHRPDAEAARAHAQVSDLCLGLALELARICPEGRPLSLALTALEECRMRANSAIAETQPLVEG